MRLLPSAAALLLFGAPSTADVLAPELVDADARVLIHVDVAALSGTTLFRLLAANADTGFEEALDEFEGEVGLDPLRDVRSVTVYSNDADAHWVALLRTTEKLDQALEALRERPGYAQREVDGKTVHALEEDGSTWYGHLYRSPAGAERLFVITEDEAALVEAVRVVDGKVANVGSAAEPAVATAPSPGAVLFVSADRGLGELGDFHPSAEVSKLVKSVLFECGEAGGELFASLRLTAAGDKEAREIHDVIQGGLALASLLSGRSDETNALGDMIDALDVRRRDAAVTFEFRYSAQAFYDGLVGLHGTRTGGGR
jgi:hypothetical protein